MQERIKDKAYYRWLIFLVVATGTFMSALTSSVVNVALPSIIGGLGTDLSTAQWIVTAYLLIITSILPLAGRLGDIYGRRIVYGFGFVCFTAGSLLCGLAGSVQLLIAARMVQAVGASALMANGPAIVVSFYPPSERGKVLGMIGTAVALGTLTGPSLGGLLVEQLNWHWVFWAKIPVGIIGYLGVHFILPQDTAARHETIDGSGACLFTVGMGSFLLVLSHGMEWGIRTPAVQGFVLLSITAFALFVWHEARVRHPMLDLTIFRSWPFLAGNLSGTLSFMALFANTILLPFYLQQMKALPPSQTGLVMSAFPIVMAITAPLSGTLSDRVGPLALTTTGLSIMTLGLYYTGSLPADAELWRIVAGQAVMGLGNGLFQSPNNNSVMSAVAPNKLGVAGGVNALARNFGMVSGTAMAVSVFEFRRQAALADTDIADGGRSAFMTGYHDALMAAAVLAIIGVLISLNRKGYSPKAEK